jgi:cobalamin biosynthesis Co2+ chelatase CbiK
MSILLKEKRTATVIANSYCEMFVLSEERYNHVLQNYPELRNVIKKMASEASEKLQLLFLMVLYFKEKMF